MADQVRHDKTTSVDSRVLKNIEVAFPFLAAVITDARYTRSEQALMLD